MINWWLMVMSRIMVMSNIMNFQDFDILPNGMVEILGLYLCKMWFPSCLSNQFSTNCHMEQKKSGGLFHGFSINWMVHVSWFINHQASFIEDPRFQMGQLPKIPNGTNTQDSKCDKYPRFQMEQKMKSNSKWEH